MKRYGSLMSALVLAMLFLACAVPVAHKKIISPDAAFDLLIVSDGSEFKSAIHDRLIERYKRQSNIDIISIDRIAKVSSDLYDAVVIMDSCMAWSGFNLSTKNYLDRTPAKEKIVLLMTADDPDWKFSYNDVDAITSASVSENEEKVFTLISMQIDHIFTQGKK